MLVVPTPPHQRHVSIQSQQGRRRAWGAIILNLPRLLHTDHKHPARRRGRNVQAIASYPGQRLPLKQRQATRRHSAQALGQQDRSFLLPGELRTKPGQMPPGMPPHRRRRDYRRSGNALAGEQGHRLLQRRCSCAMGLHLRANQRSRRCWCRDLSFRAAPVAGYRLHPQSHGIPTNHAVMPWHGLPQDHRLPSHALPEPPVGGSACCAGK